MLRGVRGWPPPPRWGCPPPRLLGGPSSRGVPPIPHPQKGMAVPIEEEARPITGGVDTHADTHVAAALDSVGGLLGVGGVPPTPAGYAPLLGWLGGVRARCLGGIAGAGR